MRIRQRDTLYLILVLFLISFSIIQPVFAIEIKDLLDLDALKAEQANCDKTHEDCMARCSQLAVEKDYKKCTSKCNNSLSGCIGRSGKDVIIDQLAKEVKKRQDQKLAQEIAAYAQKRLEKQRKEFKKCYSLSNDCIEACYGYAAKKLGKKKRDWASMSSAELNKHNGLLGNCTTKNRCYFKSNDCMEKVVDSIPVVDSKMEKMIKKLK